MTGFRLLSLRRLALAWVACVCLPALLFAGTQDGKLDIYWIDVEGGAATLMVTPMGETVLVDCGNPGRRDVDRIVKAVAAAGCKKIDHLVITHYHRDHFGGTVDLAAQMPIVNLYDNGMWKTMPEPPPADYLDVKCGQRVALRGGAQIPVANSIKPHNAPLTIKCLGGMQQFVAAPETTAANDQICADAKEKNRDGSDNANSLVLLVEFGPFRFFDAGDLTWNQETKLVCPKNVVGKVDVYQVTHHGLDASNNPLVVRSLDPQVAIMNNGTTKGCAPEVFATLTEQKSLAALYQVHKNLRPDGATNNVSDEYIANREQDCQGNLIHLSVEPDGKSYTVSIPANKHSRKFETRVE